MPAGQLHLLKVGPISQAYEIAFENLRAAGDKFSIRPVTARFQFKLQAPAQTVAYPQLGPDAPMTFPVNLPLVGKVRFRETTKERLLEFWSSVVQKTGLKINFNERLDTLESDSDGFLVKTNKRSYRTQAVLLAIGRRGTPRKLGVPGEEQNKVVYRLVDPAQYQGKHVLIVGGGDSALEAATSLAEESGTRVTLSYRSESFSRAKEKNRRKVDAAAAQDRLSVLMSSNVKEIGKKQVTLETEQGIKTLPNDAVIVCAGGILPTGFLKGIGIAVETKYGAA